MRGLLDDYAFTALACLDAYEVTGAMSYFKFAQQIADEMVRRFGDATSGGFFDTEATLEDKLQLGALSARRKPFQDAPTPAGNPSAAIALLRLYAYTNDAKYRDKAEDTLQVFAAMAEQFGIYAGTYGIAATWLSRPHTQAVVVGEDQAGGRAPEGRGRAVRGQQVGGAPDRQRSRGAKFAAGAGGDRAESSCVEGKD